MNIKTVPNVEPVYPSEIAEKIFKVVAQMNESGKMYEIIEIAHNRISRDPRRFSLKPLTIDVPFISNRGEVFGMRFERYLSGRGGKDDIKTYYSYNTYKLISINNDGYLWVFTDSSYGGFPFETEPDMEALINRINDHKDDSSLNFLKKRIKNQVKNVKGKDENIVYMCLHDRVRISEIEDSFVNTYIDDKIDWDAIEKRTIAAWNKPLYDAKEEGPLSYSEDDEEEAPF